MDAMRMDSMELLQLFRTTRNITYSSRSLDAGLTWGAPERNALPNPNSKLHVIRLSNGAQFQLDSTETGVAYGNSELRMALQLDAGGVPSGIGQLNNLTTGEATGMRWVSLPSR
jgi:predicted neuraminidase